MKCYSCIYLTGAQLDDGRIIKLCNHDGEHDVVPEEVDRCGAYYNYDKAIEDLEA